MTFTMTTNTTQSNTIEHSDTESESDMAGSELRHRMKPQSVNTSIQQSTDQSKHTVEYLCGRHLLPARHTATVELPKTLHSVPAIHDAAEELRYSQLTQTARCSKCHSDECYALLDYAYVPQWLKDNAYLHTGYRVNIGWKNSLQSACHLHNETLNVWTHLAGFIVIVVLYILMLSTLSPYGYDRLDLRVYATNNPYVLPTVQQYIPFNTHNNSLQYLHNDTSDDIVDHNIVDDFNYQQERLTQLLHNVQSNIPTLYQLIDVLKNKVYESELLHDNMSINHTLIEWSKQEFLHYISNVEDRFDVLRDQLSNYTLANLPMAKQSADKYHELSHALRNKYGQLTDMLMANEFDVLTASRAIVTNFTAHLINSTQQLTNTAKQEFAYFVPSSNSIHHKLEQLSEAITSVDTTEWLHIPQQESNTGLHSYLSRWPLGVYMITAMCCLLFSSIYHLFNAVSHRIAVLTQCLDYAGISLLITGSNIPVIYYGFYCAPMLRATYLCIVSLCGFTVFMITILPKYRPLKYKILKTSLFIALGVAGAIPLGHLMIHFGSLHFIFWYLLAMGAFYLLGAAIYLSQIPERWIPGKFDIWFSSHQLWHILIFIAVLTLYTGLRHFYEWRMHKLCHV